MNPFYENKDAPLQISSSLNMEFPEHLHGHTEILFVRQGRIRVNIMGESRELKEGDCAVIFPQKIHSYHSPGGSLSWLLIFGSTLAGSYLHSLQEYSPSTPFLSAGSLHPDVPLAFERLYASSGDIPLCSAWIQVLLANICPSYLSKKKTSRRAWNSFTAWSTMLWNIFRSPLPWKCWQGSCISTNIISLIFFLPGCT